MLVGVLAVAAALGVVGAAAFLFRRYGRGSSDPVPDGPTAGHAGSMLSALFLLVFAIAIVVPWTTADAARLNTYTESHAAVETYWAAAGLPAPANAQVQGRVHDYVRFVVDKEWPLMAEGRLSPEGEARLNALRTQVTSVVTSTDDARNAQADVLDQVQDMSSSRRQRAADARAAPPPGVLPLTIVTGLFVILFPFLAGARPRGWTLVPLSLMAGLLGMGVYLTWQISHVFASGLSVGPDAFTAALLEFQQIPSIG
ncbi:DUF4239 domain-containing protein [Sphaerisporangium sp. TRM90804]|uniref:bestrophin-like domain n=1 Tax=Sphaerisporangium sp. TRM90804 TaxID=3031113 RepID=UPI002446923D|nr:DUF4239 domain-containing protein [Sphaerisporangium sp. TRM90804]MDH2424027.1 DUF4239 domain-containing protein [Sphaerisporangium sp. TRM90804]